ncbi:thioesterase family protein [Bradyrhizobium sp. 192]|nr:thioesterase family protein [Bradyrhizobium sp. 192]
MFGGQFLAQSVSGWLPSRPRARITLHTLHGYFLQSRDERKPVTCVERMRDGKSFATPARARDPRRPHRMLVDSLIPA